MDFQWIVKFVWAIEEIGVNKIKKITIVVEEMQGQYPQSMAIDFLKDKTTIAETLKAWDVVNVSVNFRAQEGTDWTGRHFNSINGWKVALLAKSTNEEAAE